MESGDGGCRTREKHRNKFGVSVFRGDGQTSLFRKSTPESFRFPRFSTFFTVCAQCTSRRQTKAPLANKLLTFRMTFWRGYFSLGNPLETRYGWTFFSYRPSRKQSRTIRLYRPKCTLPRTVQFSTFLFFFSNTSLRAPIPKSREFFVPKNHSIVKNQYFSRFSKKI